MGTTPEDVLETPVWRFPSEGDGSSTISATYIFGTRLGKSVDASGLLPGHFRLKALNEKLRSDSDVRKELIEPIESFFDDIARGGLGRMGRPLVFLCEAPTRLDQRTIVMHRPNFTEYHSENRHIRLKRPDSTPAEVTWALRDAFSLFESGHLLYLLSLVSIDGQLDRIDEFTLIQLQKLLNPLHETTNLRNELKFSLNASRPVRLEALVSQRLTGLAKGEGTKPNGVQDILKKYVLEDRIEFPRFGIPELRSLIFVIEDNKILRDTREFKGRRTTEPREERSAAAQLGETSSPANLPRLYALSGFISGVLDFAEQDTSELESTLEPLFERDDWMVYCSPQCLIEIGSSPWRSLQVARNSLGTCPYLALKQCMVVYHELLLDDLERQVDGLLYHQGEQHLQKKVHATAMEDLITMLRHAGKIFWSSPEKVVERKLRQRIAIVRDLLIFKPINIFSYKSGHDLFDALAAYHNFDARTAAITDLLDRYEGLVEDSHQVLTMTTERRLGLLLALIALLGVLTVYQPLEDLLGQDDFHLIEESHLDLDRVLFVAAAFALLALYVLWSRRR